MQHFLFEVPIASTPIVRRLHELYSSSYNKLVIEPNKRSTVPIPETKVTKLARKKY